MRRTRNAKIVATLGPASDDLATIRSLFDAGADVFRLNFSHGVHADHSRRLELVRQVERDTGRPVGVLLDLQGPKLRIGTFADGPVTLREGASFRLDLDFATAGDGSPSTRSCPTTSRRTWPPSAWWPWCRTCWWSVPTCRPGASPNWSHWPSRNRAS